MTGEQECTMVGMVGWEPVSQPECSRRRVVLAGRVIDKRSKAPITGATVEIRQAVKSGKGTPTSGAALDRTLSHSGGLFYFLDLRPGTYHLHVSAPHLGTRYGEAIVDRVGPIREDAQKPTEVGDVRLPPTCVVGHVTCKKKPIGGAQIRLHGDTRVVVTDAEGYYEFSPLIASRPTIEVTAQDFKPSSKLVQLEPGQEQIVDVELKPKAKSAR